jgi:hypothetical protein
MRGHKPYYEFPWEVSAQCRSDHRVITYSRYNDIILPLFKTDLRSKLYRLWRRLTHKYPTLTDRKD